MSRRPLIEPNDASREALRELARLLARQAAREAHAGSATLWGPAQHAATGACDEN